MMQLLNYLGLLGLLGIIALIIIYIIKPNYQLKFISSTYIWQLSLKYRKKRLPTSKLRNLLLFLLQVLILSSITGILAMPVIAHKNETDQTDVIVIIDSSASMYAGSGGDLRFTRAVEQTMDLVDDTISDGGYVSVILAEDKPEFLGRRVSAGSKAQLMDSLRELLEDETACSYGSSDIEGALELSEEVLAENPSASIRLLTDKTYQYGVDGIEVISVAMDDEWNAAILNATAEMDDAYYQLTVDVACYGRDWPLSLNVEISGANAFDATEAGEKISFSRTVYCDANKTKTMIFRYGGGEESEDVIYYDIGDKEKFYSFQTIHLFIEEEDSFAVDNVFDIYGGQKEVLKVEYASSDPNIFFTGALLALQKTYSERWNIQITDVKKGDAPATEGFDFYIFEHKMPELLPSDGIVFLVDPDRAPVGSGFVMEGVNDLVGESVSLTGGEEHPVLKNILADTITVSRYNVLRLEEPYDVIMTCDTRPVVLLRKQEQTQVAIMSFSLHYSNLAAMPEFILLLSNMFEYFLPATVEGNTFEVGEQISMYGRGPELYFSGIEEPYTEFPATVTLDLPGTYTLTQKNYFEKEVLPVNIFVKIPRAESNIHTVEDALSAPDRDVGSNEWFDDLLVYLAAALVALVFIERWLQAQENK